MKPVFGQDVPPLEKTWPRDRSCGTGRHLMDSGIFRCTECGIYADDMCVMPGCQERGYDGWCPAHGAAAQPEAQA